MAAESASGQLDVGVLSAEQREKLRLFKIQTRIDNEEYLMAHPEVEILVGDFLRDVLLKRPTDICAFAADHFTNPNLPVLINAKMETINTD
ncbi:RIIa domain-containing protein 1 [Dunckerocampus dactyliophorus]|uniref:RIIa domain-containing protein 1 n=1 Tax=Dunckerocampus dactyliophorus TaxID=161453 RepID=UPI0024055EB8|nr:RIIa domain-containing protein 1 [Dunckerocampus dactyliophorus]